MKTLMINDKLMSEIRFLAGVGTSAAGVHFALI